MTWALPQQEQQQAPCTPQLPADSFSDQQSPARSVAIAANDQPFMQSVLLHAQFGQPLAIPESIAAAFDQQAATWSHVTLIVWEQHQAAHMRLEVGLVRGPVCAHPQGCLLGPSFVPVQYLNQLLQLSDQRDNSGRLDVQITPGCLSGLCPLGLL